MHVFLYKVNANDVTGEQCHAYDNKCALFYYAVVVKCGQMSHVLDVLFTIFHILFCDDAV